VTGEGPKKKALHKHGRDTVRRVLTAIRGRRRAGMLWVCQTQTRIAKGCANTAVRTAGRSANEVA